MLMLKQIYLAILVCGTMEVYCLLLSQLNVARGLCYTQSFREPSSFHAEASHLHHVTSCRQGSMQREMEEAYPP